MSPAVQCCKGILKAARPPTQNITKEEKAISALKKDNIITVLPAGKGITTIIMDTEKYEKQMETMLKDNYTYEELKKDPIEEKKTDSEIIAKTTCIRIRRKQPRGPPRGGMEDGPTRTDNTATNHMERTKD